MIQVIGKENSFRYGGDEFAALCPASDQSTTIAVVESLRNALLHIADPGGRHVTASLGVACLPESATTPEELVYRADMAMYFAKASGKDRVATWRDAATSMANESALFLKVRRG